MRKLESFPYSSPRKSALPEMRVNQERPFKYTSINFCGPVFIRWGQKMKKLYIEEEHQDYFFHIMLRHTKRKN